MITTDEIKKLAHLARIAVTEEEVAGYAKDFEAILGYVDQINTINIEDIKVEPLQVNHARIDENAHVSGQYRDAMLADAPGSQDGFYKVPKIL